MSIPRNEYPRPQFERRQWLCLNGPWQFEIDCSDTGKERGLLERDLSETITVPFCPESKLSGIEHVDFMDAVWYRRTVTIPPEWKGNKALLHFQACDYDTTVWVNGQYVRRHRGGFTPFECDLSEVASPGEEITIVVRARDLRSTTGKKPSGKQSSAYANHGCVYTRTTGIWQTVWMEPVPQVHLKRPRITPDVTNSCFRVTGSITNNRPGTKLRMTLTDDKGPVVSETTPADKDFTPMVDLAIPADRVRLWSPEDPFLYGLEIELLDSGGKVIDSASSYSGLRSVTIDGHAIKINGRAVFQRTVLDQGYYPDGIMTAPSDEALIRDIQLSQSIGFNGARLHQKVFEERFLYHADRMGYLVWGEFGDWGMDRTVTQATYVGQWLEVLARDFNHPSIIGWCPLNETAEEIGDRITGVDDIVWANYLACKAMDPTRPVIDSSGYSHRVPDVDVYDSHDYDQNPATVAERHAGLAEGNPYVNRAGHPGSCWSEPYRGQPYFVSEFGGTWWCPQYTGDENAWGYGDRPKSLEEFYERFKGLCDVMLDNPKMFGYCYTQMTDVFQEQNGVLYFDRTEKFDAQRLHAIQTRKAAIEK